VLVKQNEKEKAKLIKETKLAEQIKQDVATSQTMNEIINLEDEIKSQQIQFENDKKVEKENLMEIVQRQKDIIRQIEEENLLERAKILERIKKRQKELKNNQQKQNDVKK